MKSQLTAQKGTHLKGDGDVSRSKGFQPVLTPSPQKEMKQMKPTKESIRSLKTDIQDWTDEKELLDITIAEYEQKRMYQETKIAMGNFYLSHITQAYGLEVE
jgi:hypothetical protein